MGDSGKEALAPEKLDACIEAALAEDADAGAITTDAIIPLEMTCRGKIICKQGGVIAGLPVAKRVFHLVDDGVQFDAKARDGEKVEWDQVVVRLQGSARSMLKAERVALNFLQHMSGIASLTAKYVQAVNGTKTKIIDTRKTTPGMRALEKYSTRMGGAVNHRAGLFDVVLIKDSHIALGGGVGGALRATHKAYPELDISVEVSNILELEGALERGARRIILDNFAPGQVREARSIIRGRAEVEVSGGVQLASTRAYALAGSDYIRVGALTHSATALDFIIKVTT